jgi:protein NrfD
MTSAGFAWIDHTHWHLLTALYLFTAALGGGAYLSGVVAYALGRDGQRPEPMAFARWAFLTAVVAAGISGTAILAHLARPLHGVLFPLTLSEFGSWITRGTWILVSLAVLSAIQTLWFHFGDRARDAEGPSTFPRQLAGLVRLQGLVDRVADLTRPSGRLYWAVTLFGFLPALGTVYTGFELAAVKSVPLWNNPTLLPVLFIVSGVAAGAAVALALTVAFEGVTDRLVVGFAGVVGAGLLVTVGLLWTLWSSVGASPAGEKSMALLNGDLGALVVLLAVGIGVSLVASPVLAWLWHTREETAMTRWVVRPGLVVSLLAGVFGTFLIRYVIVFGAVQDPVVVAAVV